MTDGSPTIHHQSEDFHWTIDIPDHPARTDSSTFRNAKETFDKIMASLPGDPYGPGPWQAHHGGSLWVHDGSRWRLLLNEVGVEWSAQFCGDPAKVDLARQTAAAVYTAFPDSLDGLKGLGCTHTDLVTTTITDARGVAAWTDSIFNSCVPLAGPVHTGSVAPVSLYGGIHHYPKPIWDIQFFKESDFTLWVIDTTGDILAVVPASPRGSGDGTVEVAYAPPGHPFASEQQRLHALGRRLLLPPTHPLAIQAFARQES